MPQLGAGLASNRVAAGAPPRKSRHGSVPICIRENSLPARPIISFNSTFTSIAASQRIDGPPASTRGIFDGGNCWFSMEVGSGGGNRKAGSGLGQGKWAKLSDRGQELLTLSSEKLTDMGNSATFYSVLLGVEGFGASAGAAKASPHRACRDGCLGRSRAQYRIMTVFHTPKILR